MFHPALIKQASDVLPVLIALAPQLWEAPGKFIQQAPYAATQELYPYLFSVPKGTRLQELLAASAFTYSAQDLEELQRKLLAKLVMEEAMKQKKRLKGF